MTDSSNSTAAAQQTRRAFFCTSAEVAVTAPAVAVLLGASTKSAKAQSIYSTDFVGASETVGAAFNGGNDDAALFTSASFDDNFTSANGQNIGVDDIVSRSQPVNPAP